MIEVLFVYKKRLGTEVATGRYIRRIVMRNMAISNAIQLGWVFTYQFPSCILPCTQTIKFSYFSIVALSLFGFSL